jgi:membrane protein DedA with SNARE-associated domain
MPALLAKAAAAGHHLASYGYLGAPLAVGVECLGIPIPGEAALVAVAAYAGKSHRLNIAIVIATSIAAGAVGSAISYAVGRIWGMRVLVRVGRYVRLTEPRVKLMMYVFNHYGTPIVAFGRFVAALRAFLGLFAGALRYPVHSFLLVNTLALSAWATFYGLAAYYLGSVFEKLQSNLKWAFVGIALVAAVGLVLLLRRHEKALVEKARTEYPLPLEAYI